MFTGMLSKSRGLVVRLSAVLHVLFSAFADGESVDTEHDNVTEHDSVTDHDSSTVVSERAVEAAIDFIKLSCQQTIFCAGRSLLEEELLKYTPSECFATMQKVSSLLFIL